MRKCPKCGKTYDDTWKICLHCSVNLSDDMSIKESQIESQVKKKNNVFWKIYFWFFCVLLIVGYVYTKSFGIIYSIDLIISFPSTVGFFLYVYRKRWLDIRFWKAYVPLYYLWDICFNLVILPRIEGKFPTLETVLGFALIVPMWVALYLYAYRFLNEKRDLR